MSTLAGSARPAVTLSAALAKTLATPSAQAALTTLKFDGAVDTDITSDHAGLTFNSPVSANGPVRSWSFVGADTPGNVLGLAGGYALNQADAQAIDIIFATAMSQVSIRAMFSAGIGRATLAGLALARRRRVQDAVVGPKAWATPSR